MGTLLGQLPFPGAGGEGSAAGGVGSDPRLCQEWPDVWLPLPLLGIAKPLPRGSCRELAGRDGPEILAGGHLPFPRGQPAAPGAGRGPDLPSSCCWHREPSGAQPGVEPRNLVHAWSLGQEGGTVWNPAAPRSLNISQPQLWLLLGSIVGAVLFSIFLNCVEKGTEGTLSRFADDTQRTGPPRGTWASPSSGSMRISQRFNRAKRWCWTWVGTNPGINPSWG